MPAEQEHAVVGPGPLRTPHVALDTEVFRGEGFNFATAHLTRLRDAGRAGTIELYVTDVTDREVRARIHREVREAAEKLSNRLRQETRVLHHVAAHAGLATKVDVDAASRELEAAYDAYLADARVTTIATAALPVGPVLRAYFEGSPPFGGGDKKSEFPDAFTVAGLAAWCEDEGAEMYVVSGDAGVRAACGAHARLLPLARMGQLLEILTEAAAAEAGAVARAHASFDALRPAITGRVEEEFSRLAFTLDTDEYANPDVDQVVVTRVRFGAVDLAELDPDVAAFELSATVGYTAEVSFDDPEATYYDREDGVTHVFNRISGEASDSSTVPVVVRILLDSKDPEEAQLDEVTVNDGNDVAVSLYDFDRHPERDPDED